MWSQSGWLGDDARRVRISRLHRLRLRALPFAEVGVRYPVRHLVFFRQDKAMTDTVTQDGAFCRKRIMGSQISDTQEFMD